MRGADKEHGEVEPYDDEPHLSRPHIHKGKTKLAGNLIEQKYIKRKRKIAAKSEQRYRHANIGRKTHAGDDDELADRIDRMINKITIARPLDFSVAGERSVKRIAEPIHQQ